MRLIHVIAAALLLAALAPPVHAANANIYLSWRNSGYDLAPGYRVYITLTAQYTNIPFHHVWGEAYVQSGAFRAELVPDPNFWNGATYYLNVYINDERVLHTRTGDATALQGEVSTVLSVEVDCNGNAVVYHNGQQVGAFHVSGDASIMENSVDGGSVRLSSESIGTCNSDGSGSGTATYRPPPPSGSSLLSALDSGARTAGIIVGVMFGVVLLLLLLARAGGAKRLAHRAVAG